MSPYPGLRGLRLLDRDLDLFRSRLLLRSRSDFLSRSLSRFRSRSRDLDRFRSRDRDLERCFLRLRSRDELRFRSVLDFLLLNEIIRNQLKSKVISNLFGSSSSEAELESDDSCPPMYAIISFFILAIF